MQRIQRIDIQRHRVRPRRLLVSKRNQFPNHIRCSGRQSHEGVAAVRRRQRGGFAVVPCAVFVGIQIDGHARHPRFRRRPAAVLTAVSVCVAEYHAGDRIDLGQGDGHAEVLAGRPFFGIQRKSARRPCQRISRRKNCFYRVVVRVQLVEGVSARFVQFRIIAFGHCPGFFPVQLAVLIQVQIDLDSRDSRFPLVPCPIAIRIVPDRSLDRAGIVVILVGHPEVFFGRPFFLVQRKGFRFPCQPISRRQNRSHGVITRVQLGEGIPAPFIDFFRFGNILAGHGHRLIVLPGMILVQIQVHRHTAQSRFPFVPRPAAVRIVPDRPLHSRDRIRDVQLIRSGIVCRIRIGFVRRYRRGIDVPTGHACIGRNGHRYALARLQRPQVRRKRTIVKFRCSLRDRGIQVKNPGGKSVHDGYIRRSVGAAGVHRGEGISKRFPGRGRIHRRHFRQRKVRLRIYYGAACQEHRRIPVVAPGIPDHQLYMNRISHPDFRHCVKDIRKTVILDRIGRLAFKIAVIIVHKIFGMPLLIDGIDGDGFVNNISIHIRYNKRDIVFAFALA